MTDNTHWTVGNELNFVKQNEPTGEFEQRPLEPRAWSIIFSDKAVLLCKQHKDSRNVSRKVNLTGAKWVTTSEHKQHRIYITHYYFSLAQECTSKAKTPGYCNLACFGVHCSVLLERAKETAFLCRKLNWKTSLKKHMLQLTHIQFKVQTRARTR